MSSERDWPARRAFRVVSNSVVREEVDAELRFHLEGRIEELMGAGMSRTDAEREARRRFGDADRIGAELQSIDADTRRRQSVHDMWSAVVRDARLAFRGLVTRPGYTAIIVLTLGLAIGANTAVYSAVRSVLLRPLPVKDLDRVVALRVDMPKLQLLDTELSAGDVLDLRERRDLFAGLAGVTATNMTPACVGTRESPRCRAEPFDMEKSFWRRRFHRRQLGDP
jgi:hypothetical protein